MLGLDVSFQFRSTPRAVVALIARKLRHVDAPADSLQIGNQESVRRVRGKNGGGARSAVCIAADKYERPQCQREVARFLLLQPRAVKARRAVVVVDAPPLLPLRTRSRVDRPGGLGRLGDDRILPANAGSVRALGTRVDVRAARRAVMPVMPGGQT